MQEEPNLNDSLPNDEASDSDFEDEIAFDWTVFIIRAAAFVIFGATLITSYDLSFNEEQHWLTVMRLAVLPFAAGMLVLAAAELVDRRGD